MGGTVSDKNIYMDYTAQAAIVAGSNLGVEAEE